MKRQFTLTSLLMANDNVDVAKLTPDDRAKFRAILPAILANYDEVKANRQELSGGAASLILGLPDPAEKQALSKKLVSALDRLAADTSVPLDDRLSTASAEVALSKCGQRRESGARCDGQSARARGHGRQGSDGSRDAPGGDAPTRASCWPTPATMQVPKNCGKPSCLTPLRPITTCSISPTWPRPARTIRRRSGWLKQAAEAAQGPATRIQWAISYSNGVIRMAPDDKAAVAESAGMVIDALGRNDSGYAERTEKKGRRLEPEVARVERTA